MLLVTSFILSSCTIKDQIKSKILDKVETKVSEEKSEMSDEQLLKELSADDTQVDADFKALETELQ